MYNSRPISSYNINANNNDNSLEITIKINLPEPVLHIQFLLDKRYRILNCVLNSLKFEVLPSDSRTEDLIVLETSTVFQSIEINYMYEMTMEEHLLPDKIHFPLFIGYQTPHEIRINLTSTFPVITNAQCNGSNLFVTDDLTQLVIIWNHTRVQTSLYINVQGQNVFADNTTKELFGTVDINLELTKFLSFYYELFDLPLNVKIIDIDGIPANAISYRNLIIINSRMSKKPLLLLYKYLFHEIIHQEIGIRTRFKGSGRFWMLESFTEFVQLLYLKERFDKDFLYKQLHYYYKLFIEHNNPDDPQIISSFEFSTDNDHAFLALICGKGVLAFYNLYRDFIVNKQQLNKIIKCFNQYNHCISLDIFKNILHENDVSEVDVFWTNWLNSSNIPIALSEMI